MLTHKTYLLQYNNKFAFKITYLSHRYLETFIMFWSTRLPDLSDGKVYNSEDLLFWVKLRQKRKGEGKKTSDPSAAHRIMCGLRAKGLHDALDWAISVNKWPVQFTVNGNMLGLL